MSRSEISQELNRIREQNRGLLKAPDVVESARAKSSPLHSYFEWDNNIAGDKYRLAQARELIRVSVTMLEPVDGGKTLVVREFRSLLSDRVAGNGYRTLVSIMSDRSLREQLLAEAYADMERFQERYAQLKELSEVFKAMRSAGKRGRKASA
jgi:hypothetical protein